MQVDELISQIKSTINIGIDMKSFTNLVKRVRDRRASFFVGDKTAYNAVSNYSYPLKNFILLNFGSTDHICNEISRFINFQHALPGDYLIAGDSKVPILEYGDVNIALKTCHETRIMRLFDATYCKGFTTNLVSLRKLRRLGYY